MSSGGVANGRDSGSMTPPTARLPLRLGPKDVWHQGPEANREHSQQDRSWNTSRDRVQGAWVPGRDHPEGQVWSCGRDQVRHTSQEQTWVPGRYRDRSVANQAWTAGLARGPEQGWADGRDPVRSQAWNASGDPGGGQSSSGPEQAWGTSQDQTWSATRSDQDHVWRPGEKPLGEGGDGLLVVVFPCDGLLTDFVLRVSLKT